MLTTVRQLSGKPSRYDELCYVSSIKKRESLFQIPNVLRCPLAPSTFICRLLVFKFWHQISQIFVTVHRIISRRIMEGSSISKKKSAIPEGLLPSYLATAFGEIYEEDGLAVLGKGLGWLSLLAAFVRFYSDVEEGHVSIMKEKGGEVKGKPPLVLVLGLRDSEHEALLSLLEVFHTPQHMLPTLITNESGQGKDRARKSSLWKDNDFDRRIRPTQNQLTVSPIFCTKQCINEVESSALQVEF
jgi:hypothetical protein